MVLYTKSKQLFIIRKEKSIVIDYGGIWRWENGEYKKGSPILRNELRRPEGTQIDWKLNKISMLLPVITKGTDKEQYDGFLKKVKWKFNASQKKDCHVIQTTNIWQ